jgi:hypothetical protein
LLRGPSENIKANLSLEAVLPFDTPLPPPLQPDDSSSAATAPAAMVSAEYRPGFLLLILFDAICNPFFSVYSFAYRALDG